MAAVFGSTEPHLVFFVLVGGSCGAADVDGGVVRLVSRQVDLTGQPVRNSSDNFVNLLNRGFV